MSKISPMKLAYLDQIFLPKENGQEITPLRSLLEMQLLMSKQEEPLWMNAYPAAFYRAVIRAEPSWSSNKRVRVRVFLKSRAARLC